MSTKITFKTLLKHLYNTDLITAILKSGVQTTYIVSYQVPSENKIIFTINHDTQIITNKSNITLTPEGNISVPNYIVHCFKKQIIT